MISVSRTVLTAAVAALIAVSPAAAGSRQGGEAPKKKAEMPAELKGKAELSGKVTDDKGKGVGDAKVTLVMTEVGKGFSISTKGNGSFKAKDIKPGEYKVQIESPNFIVVRQTVTVAEAKNPPLDVQLKRDNSPELVAKAEALYQAGQLTEARTEYLKVLEAHPELTNINRAIAFTYGKEGKHAEALKYLDAALAANPDDLLLLQLAAASATQINDFPRAMGYLDKIDVATLIDEDPLVNAAINFINKQHSAEAIAVLDKAVTRFPDLPNAYFYRGFAKLQSHKNPEGKADLEKFVSMAPPEAPQLAQAKDLLSKIK